MFNLEPSVLEKDIYQFVVDKLKDEGDSFEAYAKIEDVLLSVFQEIVAQHKAALHFNSEALKLQKEREHAND